MFFSSSAALNASRLRWGWRRDIGQRRTSTKSSMRWALSNSINASMARVEWPMVWIVRGAAQVKLSAISVIVGCYLVQLMLSSRHVSFDPADFVLVRLFRFPRHLLSLLQSLSARKRRLDRHRSRFGAGDLAFDRHDGAAVLGPSGRPHRRAHALAGVSHAGDR